MIKISVDEAYAFDFLSILEVKKKYGVEVSELLTNHKHEIIDQIGYELFYEIYTSQEYLDLLEYNLKTFEAVDKAKTDEVPASYVDKCNYLRSIAKKKLQNKFFNKELTEIKHGYEKLKNL